MDLHVPDDILKAANLTPEALRLEVACRLFDADVIDFQGARRLSGLTRPALEHEMFVRKIPVFRPRLDDVLEDLRELREERARREGGAAA